LFLRLDTQEKANAQAQGLGGGSGGVLGARLGAGSTFQKFFFDRQRRTGIVRREREKIRKLHFKK
jgi:hypothetical protein